jgi:hypothetical protein
MKKILVLSVLALAPSLGAAENVTTELNRCFILKGAAPASPIPVPTKVCLDRVHVALGPKGPHFNTLLAVGTATVDGKIWDLPLTASRAWPDYEYEGTKIVSYSSSFFTRTICRTELSCLANAEVSLSLWIRFEPADAAGRPRAGSWKVEGVLTTYNPNGRYDRFEYEAR